MVTEHGRHRLLVAAILTAAIAILTACSGGDSSEPLTPAEAETIASDALLVLADLPTADWEQQDAQTGLDGLLPGGAGDADIDILPDACAVIEDAISDLPSLLEEITPLATSSRTFTASGQLVNLDAVSSSVVVFENEDDAADAAAILDEVFSADNLEGCIQAAILPAGDGGLQIVEFSLSTPPYALDDSTALTAEIAAVALIVPINLTLDLHAFQRGNALGFYVGLQVNSSTLDGEQADLLTAFANRISEAQN